MTHITVRKIIALAAFTFTLAALPALSQSTQPATAAPSSGAPPAATTNKPSAAVPAAAATPPQKGMVWVNTASGVYHAEGTKFYGKTKKGKFMTEADAQKAGYHAAKMKGKQ